MATRKIEKLFDTNANTWTLAETKKMILVQGLEYDIDTIACFYYVDDAVTKARFVKAHAALMKELKARLMEQGREYNAIYDRLVAEGKYSVGKCTIVSPTGLMEVRCVVDADDNVIYVYHFGVNQPQVVA